MNVQPGPRLPVVPLSGGGFNQAEYCRHLDQLCMNHPNTRDRTYRKSPSNKGNIPRNFVYSSAYCEYPMSMDPASQQPIVDFARTERRTGPSQTFLGPDSIDARSLLSYLQEARNVEGTYYLFPRSTNDGWDDEGFTLLFNFRTVQFLVRPHFEEYTNRQAPGISYGAGSQSISARVGNKDVSAIFTAYLARYAAGRSARNDPLDEWQSEMRYQLPTRPRHTSGWVTIEWRIKRTPLDTLIRLCRLQASAPAQGARRRGGGASSSSSSSGNTQPPPAGQPPGAQDEQHPPWPEEVTGPGRSPLAPPPYNPYQSPGYPGDLGLAGDTDMGPPFYPGPEGAASHAQPGSSQGAASAAATSGAGLAPATAGGSGQGTSSAEQPSCYPYGYAWNTPEQTRRMAETRTGEYQHWQQQQYF